MKSDLSFMKIHNNARSVAERDSLIMQNGYNFSDEELSLALDILMNDMLAKPYRKSA
jgi:hypothetical protein